MLSGSGVSANDCPTARDDISTDRPGFTNPPTVVPVNSLQIENGVAWNAVQRSNVVDGPETNVRFGVASCSEIFFGVPNYSYAIGGNAPSGFSDFVASAKRQLPEFYGFDTAATAGLSFPTGGTQISSHGYDPYLQLPWTHAIDDNWAVDGMFTVTWLTSQPQENPTFQPTIEIERDFGNLANIFAEYAAQYPHHDRPTHILDGGGIWRITPTQQIDIDAGFGLNRPSPDHFVGIGYSFRLDGLF